MLSNLVLAQKRCLYCIKLSSEATHLVLGLNLDLFPYFVLAVKALKIPHICRNLAA